MSTTGQLSVRSRLCSLLHMRNFQGCKILAELNKSLGKDWPELDQAIAICDVMKAVETPFSNGLMDFYGMIRTTRFGQVILDDFLNLSKLLSGEGDCFPCSQDAAQHALHAWSILSKHEMRLEYDTALSAFLAGEIRGQNLDGRVEINGGGEGHGNGGIGGSRGYGRSQADGGSSFANNSSNFVNGESSKGGGSYKGKEHMQTYHKLCTHCHCSYETESPKEFLCKRCKKFFERMQAAETEKTATKEPDYVMFPSGFPNASNVTSKEPTPEQTPDTDEVMEIVSDDENDDRMLISIARTAKTVIVDGKRVKMVPRKKKPKND